MTPTTFIILMLSFMLVALIKILLFDDKQIEKEQDMAKLSEILTQEIEKLQNNYGSCKINTKEFTEGLNQLGIYTEEEVAFHLVDAEQARYEFKLDPNIEPTTTVPDIAMPFPEKK